MNHEFTLVLVIFGISTPLFKLNFLPYPIIILAINCFYLSTIGKNVKFKLFFSLFALFVMLILLTVFRAFKLWSKLNDLESNCSLRY